MAPLPLVLVITFTQPEGIHRLQRSNSRVRDHYFERDALSDSLVFAEDVAKLSRKSKGEMPGREHEATRKAEEVALKAGATIDREV